MASVNNVMMVTFETGANLSDSVGELVKLNASGQVINTVAVGDIAIGVVAQKISESASGVEMSIAMLNGSGTVKVKANAAITRGDLVHPHTAGGRVVSAGATPTAGDFIVGQALEAATAQNDIIEIVPIGIRY